MSERERKAKQTAKSSAIDEDGDEEAEARLHRSAHKLWLIVISHVRVSLRRVIMGGRRVIVALRFLSGGLCFILLSLECYSTVDLWFAVDLQKGGTDLERVDAAGSFLGVSGHRFRCYLSCAYFEISRQPAGGWRA